MAKTLGMAAMSTLQSASSPTLRQQQNRTQAAKIAEVLLGCFRTGEAGDPRVYTAAVVELLSAYPTGVMIQVADPVNGLPSKLKWLPTIAEIKAQCEVHMEPLRRQAERDKRVAEQQAEAAARERELARGPKVDLPK